MPRPSKKATEEKAKAIVPAQPRVIDVEGFIRVRDAVHQRLLTIQDILKTFSGDFYRQTNLLLGEHSQIVPGLDPLLSHEHAVASLPLIPLAAPEFVPQAEEKKERKKRTHDPNAPKRPLTPYFLYMQTARPIIANDLGAEAPKGAVQEEGQRRWASMNPSEKAGWNNAYQYNLRLYQARVHSYKAGNPEAKNMSDAEALKYAEDFHIPMPNVAGEEQPADEQDAIAEQLQGTSADAQGEDDDDAAPPAKTPKKSSAGRKRKTATPAADGEAPKSAVPTPASPDKKRRRTSTKAPEAAPEEPKKAARGKKAKN